MTSFQDAPDENIEHDEKMELRSTRSSQDYIHASSRFEKICLP